MNIENQLLEYRAKKRREQILKDTKTKIKSFFFKQTDVMNPSSTVSLETTNNHEKEETENLLETNEYQSEEEDYFNEEPETDTDVTCCTYIDMLRYFLYFIIWASLYGLFIKLEFGIVYFITSIIIIMYLNTRTRPKKRGEISAYSVFNRNCKSIEGTLKAEQLEKQLFFR